MNPPYDPALTTGSDPAAEPPGEGAARAVGEVASVLVSTDERG
ncbi:hypothetical protein [Streptomyces albipurpureus]|nr:hypothetical protein [Streptomyces sp. CWNU-1]